MCWTRAEPPLCARSSPGAPRSRQCSGPRSSACPCFPVPSGHTGMGHVDAVVRREATRAPSPVTDASVVGGHEDRGFAGAVPPRSRRAPLAGATRMSRARTVHASMRTFTSTTGYDVAYVRGRRRRRDQFRRREAKAASPRSSDDGALPAPRVNIDKILAQCCVSMYRLRNSKLWSLLSKAC